MVYYVCDDADIIQNLYLNKLQGKSFYAFDPWLKNDEANFRPSV